MGTTLADTGGRKKRAKHIQSLCSHVHRKRKFVLLIRPASCSLFWEPVEALTIVFLVSTKNSVLYRLQTKQ
jgi:hypothetical protein